MSNLLRGDLGSIRGNRDFGDVVRWNPEREKEREVGATSGFFSLNLQWGEARGPEGWMMINPSGLPPFCLHSPPDSDTKDLVSLVNIPYLYLYIAFLVQLILPYYSFPHPLQIWSTMLSKRVDRRPTIGACRV